MSKLELGDVVKTKQGRLGEITRIKEKSNFPYYVVYRSNGSSLPPYSNWYCSKELSTGDKR